MAAIQGRYGSGSHFYFACKYVYLTRANGNPYPLLLSLSNQSQRSTPVAPLVDPDLHIYPVSTPRLPSTYHIIKNNVASNQSILKGIPAYFIIVPSALPKLNIYSCLSVFSFPPCNLDLSFFLWIWLLRHLNSDSFFCADKTISLLVDHSYRTLLSPSDLFLLTSTVA